MAKKNIFVAGHNGMVGSSLVRQLKKDSTNNILVKNRNKLNLTNQEQVNQYFMNNSIDEVYLAAAKVGGIHANHKYPAEFIYENLMIEANIINAANKTGIQKLLFLGSSCIYPKLAEQPLKESSLLKGALEPTNEPYAISKIAGIKLCESYNRQYGRDYRSVMPTNLYGPGDNYHPLNSHVIPGLIRRFHEAKINNHSEVVAWGSGEPMREFLYVDDMAEASIFIMNLSRSDHEKVVDPMLSHINVGSGEDISINELTCIVAEITGYSGEIVWDVTKADGTLKKLMDVSKLNELGWSYKVKLREGLSLAYADYLNGHRD
jgi:GDP-L-fucose synthase